MNDAVSDAEAQDEQLLAMCRLLNEHEVRYLICGGYACILHGNLRMTQDVDLLVEEDSGNYRRLIAALSRFGDGSAAELTEEDIASNLVVKINDVITIDVSRRAWVVTYAEAAVNAREDLSLSAGLLLGCEVLQLLREGTSATDGIGAETGHWLLQNVAGQLCESKINSLALRLRSDGGDPNANHISHEIIPLTVAALACRRSLAVGPRGPDRR